MSLPFLLRMLAVVSMAAVSVQAQTPRAAVPSGKPPDAPAQREDALKTAMQAGLFEEEANRDYDKAIEAYRKALTLYDTQRASGATVLYRLAECLRKKGQATEAATLYRRLLTEFPEEADLCNDSRRRLDDIAPGTAPAAGGAGITQAEADVLAELKALADRGEAKLAERAQGMLNSAAGGGQLAVVRYLTSRKIPGLELEGALSAAVTAGHLGVVQHLLSCGIDMKKAGAKALIQALDSRRYAVADALIQAGADPNATVTDLALPIHGPSNQTDIGPFQPLAMALLQRDERSARLLIEKGARCDIPDRNGRTPLFLAWSTEMAQLLVDHGADVNAAEKSGKTVLMQSLGDNADLSVAEFLVSRGAKLNAASANGTAFEQLVVGSTLWTRYFLDDSAPKEVRQSVDPAEAAVVQKRAVKLLDAALKEGWKPDSGKPGRTVLHTLASGSKHEPQLAFMAELIRRGANVNAVTEDGLTPLHFACDGFNTGAIRLLLKNGADARALTTALITRTGNGMIAPPSGQASPSKPQVQGQVPNSAATVEKPAVRFFRPMDLLGASRGNRSAQQGAPKELPKDCHAVIMELAMATYGGDFPGKAEGIWMDCNSILPMGMANAPNTQFAMRHSDAAMDGTRPMDLVESVLRYNVGGESLTVHIVRGKADIAFNLRSLTGREPPAVPVLQPGDVLVLLPPAKGDTTAEWPRDLALLLEEKYAFKVKVEAEGALADLAGDWRISPALIGGPRMDVARHAVFCRRWAGDFRDLLRSNVPNTGVKRITRADGKTMLDFAGGDLQRGETGRDLWDTPFRDPC